jgi:hypothetical protein
MGLQPLVAFEVRVLGELLPGDLHCLLVAAPLVIVLRHKAAQPRVLLVRKDPHPFLGKFQGLVGIAHLVVDLRCPQVRAGLGEVLALDGHQLIDITGQPREGPHDVGQA